MVCDYHSFDEFAQSCSKLYLVVLISSVSLVFSNMRFVSGLVVIDKKRGI